MSTNRRALSSNPNILNSPLRGSLRVYGTKPRRHGPLVSGKPVQEETASPSPPKKRMIDSGVSAAVTPAADDLAREPTRSSKFVAGPAATVAAPEHVSRSPQPRRTTTMARKELEEYSRSTTRPTTTKAVAAERVSQSQQPRRVQNMPSKDYVNYMEWRQHMTARFPTFVFFFDSVPEPLRVRLAKQAVQLGAREEMFFSNAITHVVTGRPVQKKSEAAEPAAAPDAPESQPVTTIDPALLDRSGMRKQPLSSILDTGPGRKVAPVSQDSSIRCAHLNGTSRKTDILLKARDMGKRVWSLDKLVRIMSMLTEDDPYTAMTTDYRLSRHTSITTQTATRARDESNLLELLQQERLHGPSDRDPSAASRDITYFKGPYIYVYDIEGKHRPVMTREYPSVADKRQGQWPQLRAAAPYRCPFIEDDSVEKESNRQVQAAQQPDRTRATAAKPARAFEATVALAVPPARKDPILATCLNINRQAEEEAQVGQSSSPEASETTPRAISRHQIVSKSLAGKRNISQMTGEDDSSQLADSTIPLPPPSGKLAILRPSLARSSLGRRNTENGQPSKLSVTLSRLRSADRPFFMTAAHDNLTKAKLSAEPVASGLQPSNITSAIHSYAVSSTASGLTARAGTSLGVQDLQRKVFPNNRLASAQDEAACDTRTKKRRTEQPARNKRDPKPGYCENCMERFDDFEDHINSRKHRKFAEDDSNWTRVDELISEIQQEYADANSENDADAYLGDALAN